MLAAIICLGTTLRSAPPDWVKTALTESTPPDHATAPAEYLLAADEVTYLSSDFARTCHRRVLRILTPGGRSYARVRLVYRPECEKIVSARVWLVTRNGTQSDLRTHRDFADTVQSYNQYVWDSERVLTFDASERLAVGDTLASEIITESVSGIFDSSMSFRFALPVARCSFQVTPPNGMTLAWHASSAQLHAPLPGATPAALRWEERQLPSHRGALPERFIPNPLRVSVHPIGPKAAPRTWQDLARQVHAVIAPQTMPDDAIRTNVQRLTSGVTERWARIRAVARFAQREIFYLSITSDQDYLAGYRPHAPALVAANRYGDCKDKAALLVAMLSTLGERAWVVLVYSQDPKALDRTWPAARFNHAIVGLAAADDSVPADWPCVEAPGLGRIVLFDPTNPIIPLGLLPPEDEAGLGLVVSEQTTDVLTLPTIAPGGRALRREVTAALNPQWSLQAQVREIGSGNAGAESHTAFWAQGEVEYGKDTIRRLRRIFPAGRAVQQTSRWDADRGQFVTTMELDVPDYGRFANRELRFLCPKLLPEPAHLTPWTVPVEGVVWLKATQLTETARVRLPSGWTAGALPDPIEANLPPVRYTLRYRRDDAAIVFEEHIEISAGFLDQPAYTAYTEALTLLSQHERRLVTLSRTAAP